MPVDAFNSQADWQQHTTEGMQLHTVHMSPPLQAMRRAKQPASQAQHKAHLTTAVGEVQQRLPAVGDVQELLQLLTQG